MGMEKPVNFRDLGGIETTDGLRVKPLRLLRSGELCGLSDEEKDILVNDYRLAHVIDMRNKVETDRAPDDTIEDVEFTHIDILYQHFKSAPSKSKLSRIDSLDNLHEFMFSIYTSLIQDADALEGYRRFLNILLDDSDGAVLFHCFAGKDRTGVAAAIVLTILGVDKRDIMADYLMTNQMRRAANEAILADARAEGQSEGQLQALQAAMSVDERYLERVFSIAEDECGTMIGYINKHMGMTDKKAGWLKEIYLSD